MTQTGVVDVWKLEREAQFLAAQALVGSLVVWAHAPEGPRLRVEAATSEGLVRVSGHHGSFAPHLFVRVEVPARRTCPTCGEVCAQLWCGRCERMLPPEASAP